MAPRSLLDRAKAGLARLGWLGVTGLLIALLIFAYVAADWLPPASAVAP